VVLPAWIEHQPRRLLQAVAAGVPVIASEACGLRGVRGVINVPCGDLAALRMAICDVTNGWSTPALARATDDRKNPE
jgi:glycosyltransferase involved in cell wall biosynthesis